MYKPEIEIADVIRAFGSAFQAQYGKRMLMSHRKAMADISACMTEDMGGHSYRCTDCRKDFWTYHGCRNRSCPKCHGRQTVEWMQRRSVELLPCHYFHVITTVPAELRNLFFAHQKTMYGLLMRVSAKALIELAQDRRYIGATPGVMSVLHTWNRNLQLHPHVHMLVTGGGLEEDGVTWREASPSFLVPVKKLSRLIRRRFQEALRARCPDLFERLEPSVWMKEWCVYADAKPVDKSQDTILKYLARYVFRIAITSGRIVSMDKNHVTFRYKENTTGEWKTQSLSGVEFIRRYLLHVLPKGFHKIRYFGLWSPSQKQRLRQLRTTLSLLAPSLKPMPSTGQLAEEALRQSGLESHGYTPTCPHCGSTHVLHQLQRRRQWRRYVT